MTTEDNEQSPFTKPGFIIAAVVVFLIVVLGVVIGFVNANRNDPEPAPSPSSPTNTSAAPTTEPSAVAGGASVCGLSGEVLSGSLTTAPEAKWDYQGTTAYPTSKEFGPGKTNSLGVRSCFQHSPEGAVLAAANATVQGSDSDPKMIKSWLNYFIAEGPKREAVLSQGAGAGTSGQGVRIQVAGFRLLAYDGETARVDIAVRGAANGQTVTLSMVYDLVWEGGDWKLKVSDASAPINVANIPDVAGYVTWGV